MKNILFGMILFFTAQTLAWFQTNGQLIHEWMSNNVVLTSVILGPIVGTMFAYGTKAMYLETDALWVVRFLAFASGYLVFTPLTWYFLGETPFTLKNIISFLLCVTLICVQFFMK